MSEERALGAMRDAGLEFRVVRHGPVRSLTEAAEARGVPPAAVVKTLVVRRGADDHLFVLVPGDRGISWPKLRTLLGVNRLSMPDAAAARDATGYERGTITPFGSTTAWPVVADERLVGTTITLGAGAHGVAAAAAGDDVVRIAGRHRGGRHRSALTSSDVSGALRARLQSTITFQARGCSGPGRRRSPPGPGRRPSPTCCWRRCGSPADRPRTRCSAAAPRRTRPSQAGPALRARRHPVARAHHRDDEHRGEHRADDRTCRLRGRAPTSRAAASVSAGTSM